MHDKIYPPSKYEKNKETQDEININANLFHKKIHDFVTKHTPIITNTTDPIIANIRAGGCDTETLQKWNKQVDENGKQFNTTRYGEQTYHMIKNIKKKKGDKNIMIDFSNVRIEKDKTYTFITSTNTRFIKWAFEDVGITDYQIISLIKIRKQLPKDVIIPDFRAP